MLANLTTYLRHSALFIACSALTSLALAQQNAEGKWYQVEVAVFTQPENAQLAASQETFRKDITLSYGEHTQQLQSVEEASLSKHSANLAGQLDSVASQEADNNANTDVALAGEEPLSPEMINEILQTQAFVKLPVELRNLNETVGALERRNRQRILFHEAWRQPLVDPEQAAAIILAGGNHFENEQELAGTIKFGVSRYIHVHTNIWFSEFANNVGQEQQEWPMVPTPPSGNESQIADAQINLNAGLDKSKQDLWHQYDVIDTTYQNILDKSFIVTNLATLIQTRRMRSGEVHYIDHPKIGILITVIPYDGAPANN
ncbi:CsiV family protein [Simiduia curdlanivorans]|uniref:CsiV family protein n=1 Tax=Simiduia curdlanivorans TaxID=1492769 RepID=A0ABV8VAI0_9GAMM|nr:CsiV family protein [Simiduia curdlanivorans]MDN3639575.1 CsiV family protein [Simiduia curdlanivorans]